jgi:MFS family permease
MSQAGATTPRRAGLSASLMRRIGEPRRLAATFAAMALSYLPSLTLPWAISGLVADLRISPTMAGAMMTAQLVVLSAVSIGVGFFVDRLPRRSTALVGAGIGLAGTLVVLLGPSATLLAGMIAAGLGFGLCCAVANALIGGAEQPGRLTANLWFLLLIAQAAIWYATPLIAARHGLHGVYVIIATGTVLLAPLLLATPRLVPAGAGPSSSATGSRPGTGLDWSGLLLLAICTLCFWLRDSATWSLAEQRGAALGVSDRQMAATLLGCTLLGFAGPAAASFIGDRLGRTRTLVLGLAALTVVMTAIAAARTPSIYRTGFLLWTAVSTFAWTYALEMAALLDRRGRIAAICGGLMFGAGALGPLAGGGLSDAWHGAALPVAITAMGLITLLTGTLAAARVRKDSDAGAGAT